MDLTNPRLFARTHRRARNGQSVFLLMWSWISLGFPPFPYEIWQIVIFWLFRWFVLPRELLEAATVATAKSAPSNLTQLSNNGQFMVAVALWPSVNQADTRGSEATKFYDKNNTQLIQKSRLPIFRQTSSVNQILTALKNLARVHSTKIKIVKFLFTSNTAPQYFVKYYCPFYNIYQFWSPSVVQSSIGLITFLI